MIPTSMFLILHSSCTPKEPANPTHDSAMLYIQFLIFLFLAFTGQTTILIKAETQHYFSLYLHGKHSSHRWWTVCSQKSQNRTLQKNLIKICSVLFPIHWIWKLQHNLGYLCLDSSCTWTFF